MNSFGNTLRPTLLAAWRSPTRMISKPRFAHPCVNCRTTRKKSDHSTKSHPSNTPRESVLTYGLINNDYEKCNSYINGVITGVLYDQVGREQGTPICFP